MIVSLSLVGWKTRCEHGIAIDGVCKDCFTVSPTGSVKGIDPARLLSVATGEVA